MSHTFVTIGSVKGISTSKLTIPDNSMASYFGLILGIYVEYSKVILGTGVGFQLMSVTLGLTPLVSVTLGLTPPYFFYCIHNPPHEILSTFFDFLLAKKC